MGSNPAERKFFGEEGVKPVNPEPVEGLSDDENRWMSGEKMAGQDLAGEPAGDEETPEAPSMDRAA